MPTKSDAAGTRRFQRSITVLNRALRKIEKARAGAKKMIDEIERLAGATTEIRDKLVDVLRQRKAALSLLRKGTRGRAASAGQRAAATKKRRAAGKKAAATRKRRAAGRKAATTKRRRAEGTKSAAEG